MKKSTLFALVSSLSLLAVTFVATDASAAGNSKKGRIAAKQEKLAAAAAASAADHRAEIEARLEAVENLLVELQDEAYDLKVYKAELDALLAGE